MGLWSLMKFRPYCSFSCSFRGNYDINAVLGVCILFLWLILKSTTTPSSFNSTLMGPLLFPLGLALVLLGLLGYVFRLLTPKPKKKSRMTFSFKTTE